MAQRAEAIIYAISTDDSGLVMRGDRVLEQRGPPNAPTRQTVSSLQQY